jgi:autotransporter-associated beta strand protein
MHNQPRNLLVAALLVLTVAVWNLWTPDARVPAAPAGAFPKVNEELPAREAVPPANAPSPVNWAAPEMRQDILWQKPAPEPVFAAFQDWSSRYAGADDSAKPALVPEGERLARVRRAEFARTMRENPARALELAVPFTARRSLPVEVLDLLERPVDARGNLEHFAAVAAPGAKVAPHSYEVQIHGASLRAYVTPERAEQPSRYGVPIHGYKLDEEMVVRPTAGRLMEPVEVADARAVRKAPAICATSKQDTQIHGDEAALAVADSTEFFCGTGHAALELEERTADERDAPPKTGDEGAFGPITQSAHTEGTKTLIIIRIDFSDFTNAPISEADGNNILNQISTRWNQWSYGRCTLNVAGSEVTTQILRMPRTAAWYNGGSGTLYNDALAAATAAGYNLNNYSFRMVAMNGSTPGFGWAGLGTVGGNKSWVRANGATYAASVGIHELGHNLGLNHAQSYTVGGADPIATGGTTSEYGDPYDAIGGGDIPDSYNARYRLYLNWLTGADYTTANASGIYRINSTDKAGVTGIRAMRTKRTSSQDYNIEYRTECSGNQSTPNDNGVQVRWGPNGTGNGKTQILDMTSPGNLDNAPLGVNKTFADTPNGVYLTTVAKITGTSFDSMDVLVNRADNPLPAPWTGGDIGTVAVPGLASYANGTFFINGAGADVWSTADGFHFVRRSLSGDCDIRARLPVQTNTNGYAKAGLMLRDGTDDDAAHALISITPSNGFNFQYRTTPGGTCTNVAGPALNAAPNNWVRLTRVGNVITGYRSADGLAWTQVGSMTIAMASTVSGGLAVTSHADPALGAATFDNVSVSALPSPWQTADIGAVGAAGSAIGAGSVFTVSGSGADIWGTADEFRFVYQTLSGDGEIRARVTSQTNTAAWAKAGVIIRDSIAAGSAHAMMVISPSNGFAFQYRATTGGQSTHVAGPALNPAPNNWVRLVRSGNSLTSYVSANGATWTQVGTSNIAMGASVAFGLAVDSANDGALSTAIFDNVLIGGPVPPPWNSADIGAVGAVGGAFFNGGAFAVSGAGSDIWAAADEFRFVHQSIAGNFDLRARVTSQANTNAFAKAGVMIRNGTVDSAAHAMTAVTPSNGYRLQYRGSPGGASTDVAGPALNPVPDNWVRVVRSGNSFFSFASEDGLSWTQIGSAVNIVMADTVNAGLAVCSHVDATPGTATFDNVTISSLHAPVFTNNPVAKPNAAYDVAYSSSLAPNAADSDGDPLTFSKVGGPAWLTVEPDGTMTGTPAQADLGLNSFTVRVSDPFGLSAEATLNITVTAIVTSYWDGTGASWNATASWSENASAATPNAPVPAAGTRAIFNITGVTAAQTVNLDGDQSAAGLVFNSTGTTLLQGGGTNRTLVLGNSGITINSGAGAVTLGSATGGQNVAIEVSANQQWANAATGLLSVLNAINLDGNTLTIGGTGATAIAGSMTGSGSLAKSNGGVLVLSANNTYSGTTTISAGTVQVGAGGTAGSLGAGAVTNNGLLAFNRSDNLIAAQAISGTGAVSKTGAGTLTLSGLNAYTGGTSIDTGVINVLGSQSAATGGWSVGPTAANTSTVSFQSGSSVVVAAGKQIRIGNTTAAGTASQTLNVAGGVNNNGTLYVGRPGILNLNSGAAWTQAGAMSLNAQGGYSAALNVNAGAALTYTGTGAVGIHPAAGNGGSAMLTIASGTFTTSQGFQNNIATSTGSASITLTAGGTLRLSSNVPTLIATAGSGFNFQLGTGGGVINTQGFSTTMSGAIGNVASQTGTLTKLGAGTLILSGTNTFSGGTTISAGTLQLGVGGATGSLASTSIINNGTLSINRSGSVTISLAITGTGSLVHAGPGTTTLTGANEYAGETAVSAGTLSLPAPSLSDTAAVRLSTGATLNLSHSSTDAIDKLYINGVLHAAGTWGAIGSGAAHQTSLITGPGLLNALQGALPYHVWAASSNLTGANAAMDADPDGDGVLNFVEFALNGDPASAGSKGLAFAGMHTIGGTTAFTYTIAVRSGAVFAGQENRQTAGIDGVTYTVEASQDLGDWALSEPVVEVIPAITSGLPAPSAGWDYHTFRSGTPDTTPQIFFRAQIDAQ